MKFTAILLSVKIWTVAVSPLPRSFPLQSTIQQNFNVNLLTNIVMFEVNFNKCSVYITNKF